MEMLAELAGLIARYAPTDGSHDTALPRVGLIRSAAETEPLHTLYEPSCCIVAQGRKRATVGEVAHVYDASHYLIVGVDLPVIGAVIEASEAAPYLCLRLEFDRGILADMAAGEARRGNDAAGLGLSAATPELIDAAVRLLRLLDAPKDAPVLAPLVEREILHRLLTGPQGDILRQIANGESRLNQIRRAVDFVRAHYGEAFAIEDLAAIAGMSPSSFYEHFRAVTAMSPLQFRTHIRLQEARRLMLMEGVTAAEAGFRVGYDSPSQFSRDYGRVHQVPPRRDVERMRATGMEGSRQS
jgi:AraC-like DNA-binding protein